MTEKIKIEIQAINKVTAPLKGVSRSIDTMADRATRAGVDFSNLEGEMSDFIRTTKASTEANVEFAKKYQKIEEAFLDGKMSSQEAAKAMDKLQRELKETTAAADGTEKKYRGLSGTLDNLKASILPAAAIVTGFALSLKKAWDMAKEGAALDYTVKKFDRLTESIGTTSDKLMRDLREATKKTRSDMELTQGAADLMALGLVKSHDEVVRLVTIVGALGMDTNQLVLTLTNQTTMRFDALGVSVDGFDDKVKKLKDSGMDASDAFKEAFLQQAEEQVKLLGNSADSTAGDFARLEVQAKNLGDAIKVMLVPPAMNLITTLGVIISGRSEIQAVLRDHETEIRSTAKTYTAYVTEMQRAAKAAGYHYDELGLLRDGLNRVQEGSSILTKTLWDYGDALDYVDRMSRNAAGGIGVTEEAIGSEIRSMEELALFMAGPLGKETEQFNKKQGDLTEEAKNIRSELALLGVSEYLTDDQKKQIGQLENKLWFANEELRDFAKTVKVDYKKAINAMDTDKLREIGMSASEIESWEELRRKSWSVEEAIRKLGGQPYLTDAQKKDLETNKTKLKEIESQIILNATAHEKATKSILFDMMQQQLALGGLSERESGVLWEIAYNWGLIDKETKDAYDRTIEYAGAIDASGESMDIAARKLALLTDKHIWITTTYIDEYVGALKNGTAEPPTRPGDQSDFVTPYTPPVSSGGSTLTYAEIKAAQGFTGGTDFVVPPGYPNDSYGPLWVQSGERVQVTPAKEVLDNRTFNFNYSGNASKQQITQAYEMARLLG